MTQPDLSTSAVLSVLFFMVAAIYSSVGHAGASGYTAVLALFGFSPLLIKPTSLILNIAVGTIGLYRFHSARLIDYRKILPFLLTSIPAAFFSVQLQLDKKWFFIALGGLLLFSGARFFLGRSGNSGAVRPIRVPLALVAGAVIGFFSGITGTGGAIFLTPLLLARRWASPREASGLSVVFVSANSAVGLAGIFRSGQEVPMSMAVPWVAAVLAGAAVGTHFGIVRLQETRLKQVLGVVLLIAAYKLLSQALPQ